MFPKYSLSCSQQIAVCVMLLKVFHTYAMKFIILCTLKFRGDFGFILLIHEGAIWT